MNVLTIAGRLGRDPEPFPYGDGKQGARFSMAVNNQRNDDADWFRVTCFGQSADFALRFLHKGDPAVVSGRVELDQWEDKQSGEKRSALALVADRVDGFASKREEGNAPAPRQQKPKQQAAPDWQMDEEEDPFHDQ